MTTVFEQANADGRARAARQDWSGAEQAFRRATIGAEQLNDDAAAAVALANLGRALFHAGETSKAEAALRRSVALRETLAARGEAAGLAHALNDLAVVLAAAHPSDLAGEPTALFERAMEHAATAGDGAVDRVAGNAARAHLAAGDAAAAELIVERLAARAAGREDAAEWDAALRRVRSAARTPATVASAAAPAADERLVFLAVEPDAGSDDASDRDEPSLEFLSLDGAADDTDATSGDERAPDLATMELTSLVDEPEAADTTLRFVSLLDEPAPMDAMAAVHDVPLLLDVEPTEHEAAVIADAHELAPATEPVELEMPAMVDDAPVSHGLDGLVSFDAHVAAAAPSEDDQAARTGAFASSAGARAEQRAEPRRKGKKRRGRDTRPHSSSAIGSARATPPTAEHGVPAISALPILDEDAPSTLASTAAPSTGSGAYESELEWVEAGAGEIVPRVRQTTGDFAALFDTPEYADLARTVGRFVEQTDPLTHDSSAADGEPTIGWEAPIVAVQQPPAGEPASHEPASLEPASLEPASHEPASLERVDPADAHAEPETTPVVQTDAAVVDELELPMPEAVGGESPSRASASTHAPNVPAARPERPSRERSLTPPTAMTAPTRRSWWRRLTSLGRAE